MLEPRQADLPALFLVLVVLPVVVYILLGRWGDPSKRKERIELVVGERPVQAYREEAMAPPSIIPPSFVPPSAIPPTPPPNAAIKVCARCNAPSTTRCSRCKSVRYCSGKCQIIDWRQGHKDECRPLEDTDSSLELASAEGGGHGRNLSQGSTYAQFMSCPPEQHIQQRARCSVNSQEFNPCASAATSATVVGPQIPRSERRMSEKKVSRRSTKETSDGKHRAATASTEGSSRKINDNSKEVHTWNKLRGSGFINSEDGYSEMHGINGSPISNGYTDWESTPQPNHGVKSQNRDSLCSTRRGTNANEIGTEHPAPNMNCFRQDNNCSEEVLKKKGFAEMVSSNGGTESRSVPNNECIKQAKSSKPGSKTVREKAQSSKVRKGHASDEPVTGMGNYTTGHGSNGATSIGLMKAIGLKKSSKISNLDTSAMYMDYKKVKVLFPYEEFTKFFNHEVFDLTPRGLLNCGNSCYANAVLQCLTCTKPLVTYLLSGTHSRACCLKNWCLMCELEQHVMMLREAGGPLSPSRILTHIRSINSQMADGSQEDAHEFLRLLVASMQSICLEEVGGESQVHPTLQETTFIQQTFGGRLRSMVTCLRCHHESERYENIMDLTLEINGWVESLENALTQFTTPEDLDGENMYRCARCASYVRAKKQLSIDEAPNILTIVLKRFQEGSYGKINKCITFPEMLDMIPFMTRTNDMPPLYLLYGVVVHVDTLNASFSGHYVSYVKDLQGNWFRIDDSVVQSVPTSQVMSEGAYILFYMRSSPRPPRAYMKKATKPSSRPRTRNSSDVMPQTIHRANNRYTPSMETYAEPNLIQFTDPTASDWSLFTSSDEASFTSDSTRDSFSTADYSDTCHIDPFSSVYTSAHDHPPSQRTISCRMFSGSKPVTRFVSEEKGFVQIGGNSGQVSSEAFLSDSGYQYHHQNFVNYQSDDFLRTFSNCHL